jgi:acetoin utilization deacetylase AcuC-like enzyme
MDAIYDSTQQKHDPKFFLQNGIVKPSPESPQRAEVFLKALHGAGHNIIAPEAHDSAAIQAIHTPDYLQFLETIHERWQHTGGSEEVIPNVHPNRWVANGYPDSAAGHAGWHMADTACPIGAGTWEAAQAGAKTVIDATQRALNGATAVYALCRPPGHHAFADMAGGFCYLNNSALAAQELRSQHERVAILDVDVHHGNGTQGIFYRRRDVLTVSLHADPQRFYPFFWGSLWGWMLSRAILLPDLASPRKALPASPKRLPNSSSPPCWYRKAVISAMHWGRTLLASSPDLQAGDFWAASSC